MDLLGLRIREAFHLLFLKRLTERLQDRPYAVKGGVCLRLFHGSPRLSEDLDLDIGGISGERFSRHVESIFKSQAFQAALRSAEIQRLTFKEAKRTPTTQRWKAQLEIEGGGVYPTRVECSRRRKGLLGAQPGIPARAILENHKMVPFVASHYGAQEMAVQKIEALAAPRRFACRDLFDLFHLLEQGRVDSQKLVQQTVDSVSKAHENIKAFSRFDFRREVAPFLPEDLAAYYGTPEGFEQMKGKILTQI